MVHEAGGRRHDPHERRWKRHGRHSNVFVRNYYDSVDGVTVWESKVLGGFQQRRIEDVGGGWRREVNNEDVPPESRSEFPPSYHIYANIPGQEDVRQTIDYYPFSVGVSLTNAIDFSKKEDGQSEDMVNIYPGFTAAYANNGALIDFSIRVHGSEAKATPDAKKIPYIDTLREISGLLRAGADPQLFVHSDEDIPFHADDPSFNALLEITRKLFADTLNKKQIENFTQELYNLAMEDTVRQGLTVSSDFATFEDLIASRGVSMGLIPSLNEKSLEILTEYEAMHPIGDAYEVVFEPTLDDPTHVIRSIFPEGERNRAYSQVIAPVNRRDIYKYNLYGVWREGEDYRVQFRNIIEGLGNETHTVIFPADLEEQMPAISSQIMTKDHTDWQNAVPLVPIRHTTEEAA